MREAATPKVLVVDDDPLIVRLLELNFRLAGFEVASAFRGDRVLDLATEVAPDAIVMDVTMPGLDGYEVCRQLRQVGRFTDIPVVFLTAHDPDDRVRRPELGRVEHVSKPFDPEALVATVRSAVDRGAEA